MDTVSREGVTVDLCPSCKAIWFDGGELQRVVVAKRKQFLIFDPPEGPPRRSDGLAVIDALGSILETLFWTVS